MNIGFYGHSNCAYLGDTSYLTLTANHFGAKIINVGARQGSEERILFELKKSKNIDFAVIYHSEPGYLFLPGSDRDFDLKGLTDSRANYIWASAELDKIGNNWDYHHKHHKKFIEKFESPENFKKLITDYKNYFYDPDLTMNRFYGSMIQIDQYLESRKIKAIHLIDSKKHLPSWYEFKSIQFDDELLKIFKINSSIDRTSYVNGLTTEGNIKVSEYLINIIAASGREVHTLGAQLRDGGSNPPAAPIL